jgi:hypothetical protein
VATVTYFAQEAWADTFCTPATQAGLTKVADYWKDNPMDATWRCWKSNGEDLHIEAQVDLQPWHNMTNARKIPILPGEDILHWGHSPRGTFNIQEAYAVKANLNLPPPPPPPRKVWNKIWSLKHWPKINIFLWLVAHGSILTWDNLTKRGFIGPSICPLCLEEAETMNHLLNIFPFSTQVWDHCASIMHTSDRKRDNISTTIEEWREVAFHSPILNHIWQLAPWFYPLENLEGKESKDLQEYPTQLATRLDPSLSQHNGNNQLATLD